MNKKLIYKIISVISIALGLVLLIWGFVNYFQVIIYNNSVGPDATKELPLTLFYFSGPLLFIGVFFLVLGWGKSRQEQIGTRK